MKNLYLNLMNKKNKMNKEAKKNKKYTLFNKKK